MGLIPIAKPNDISDALSFMTRNLSYFQRNYFLLFLIYFVANIILSPHSLILIGVLLALWVAFLKKNDDPQWTVQIGGVTIGPSQRWMILFLGSGVLVLVVCGSLIFSSCLCFGLAALLHSVLHQPPVLTVEEVYNHTPQTGPESL